MSRSDAGQGLRRARTVHAVLRQLVAGVLVEVRRVEQRLGGDAAHVEAGTAEGTALLNASGLPPQRGDCVGAGPASGARKAQRPRTLRPSCPALIAAT